MNSTPKYINKKYSYNSLFYKNVNKLQSYYNIPLF